MTFILNARYFLITYPQCDGLDEWAVNDHFGSLGAECIVAREDHADGGTHLHVFCDFGRKFRSRRANIFDVDGHHPNIERSKKILERVHTTRQKTETLLQEASQSMTSPLVLFQQLKIRGLLSSARRVNENFLKLLRTSVHGTSSPSSSPCTISLSGSGPSWENHMRVPPGSPLQMELFLSWLDTEMELWNTEVSHLDRRARGTPNLLRRSFSLRSGVPAPCSRGRFFLLNYTRGCCLRNQELEE